MDDAKHLELVLAGGKSGGVECWFCMRGKIHKVKAKGGNKIINIKAFLCEDCIPSMEVKKIITNYYIKT